MKKIYIIPTAKCIVFSTEENVLNSTSMNFKEGDGEGEVPGGMSNQRDASQSIWGD